MIFNLLTKKQFWGYTTTKEHSYANGKKKWKKDKDLFFTKTSVQLKTDKWTKGQDN